MGKDIPLLIGSTLNEWNFFPNQSVQPTAELEVAVRAAYSNKPELTADRVDSLIRLPMLVFKCRPYMSIPPSLHPFGWAHYNFFLLPPQDFFR